MTIIPKPPKDMSNGIPASLGGSLEKARVIPSIIRTHAPIYDNIKYFLLACSGMWRHSKKKKPVATISAPNTSILLTHHLMVV